MFAICLGSLSSLLVFFLPSFLPSLVSFDTFVQMHKLILVSFLSCNIKKLEAQYPSRGIQPAEDHIPNLMAIPIAHGKM